MQSRRAVNPASTCRSDRLVGKFPIVIGINQVLTYLIGRIDPPDKCADHFDKARKVIPSPVQNFQDGQSSL